MGRGSGLSALYPFASGEEISFDIIWVVTLAVERRVSQASGTLRDEAWMRTGEERRLRSRLPLPPQPDEVKLKMNQGTTSYRTIIAAKREGTTCS